MFRNSNNNSTFVYIKTTTDYTDCYAQPKSVKSVESVVEKTGT